MSLPLWQRPAPVEEEKQVPLTQEEAEEVVRCSREILTKQGYVLWKCALYQGETIMVTEGYSANDLAMGFPVYTLEELAMIEDNAESTLRFIYHIKKTAGGAQVVSVEKLLDKKLSES